MSDATEKWSKRLRFIIVIALILYLLYILGTNVLGEIL